ncbi:multiple sugar transport system ATP-binding protein/lactose/L-arabinose transport system ATP-binding protein [Micromonospora phaseoli]|uniref:Multiple sugar transport system ATP-binding protein/lactose/L-arabinose transport system ATP-binding protein n=1 Tax=Micromonospora phaseoli TaxID=1144548 RepID=A0A1H7E075_9ACTN|nr:ABC transporter ATP-binding protein [Micromonospora phaseoli]PZV88978.1 carbohydrate ABC transporter ATP-binding protein (CUT1 family) [Micromonospora phaseoli]GIJ80972.1 sugar ABC transporter ATP-binding protein [Micromonospora phaseoli]SEK06477.1 multiple sugar transport system ATP-binding protein/lactose/L-arabinose transport system ATP-binding protein [Micromonospora phaseoli]
MSGLVLDGVSAAYRDTTVLHEVRLTVSRGELLVVLGPSGAGKSTVLRVVAGLEPVTAGRVHIAGRDVTEARPGRRNVSMVFQSYALFPHLTVVENIAFGLEVRDTPRGEARQRARAAAETVGCAGLLDRRPGQLSGGERQRVALARALVREPDVFLLDEPLSNLDLALRAEMRAELRALHDRIGATMVHVTHDQTEALVLADRIAVLRDGRVEQVGTPDEIWRTPASTFVARFVGSPAMNLLPADGPLRPGGEAPTLPDEPLEIGFRPEAVILDAAEGTPATVDRVEVIGEDAYAYLTLSAGQPVVARVPAVRRPERGATVRLDVRWADTHLFHVASGRRCDP